MLRGIDAVVGSGELEPGRFYMSWDGQEAPRLLLCIRSDQVAEDEPVDFALVFTAEGDQRSWLEALPDFGAVVRLKDVHFRVRPHEAVSNERCTGLKPGMVIVADEQVILAVPTHGGRSYQAVDLTSGRYVVGGRPPTWVSFSSLSFVVDDGKDEREVARYEAPTLIR